MLRAPCSPTCSSGVVFQPVAPPKISPPRSLLMYLGMRKPELALAVFDWLDAQPEEHTTDAQAEEHTTDAYHYVALMSAFARRGTASDAAQVRAACGPGTTFASFCTFTLAFATLINLLLCWLDLPVCLHYMSCAACSATHPPRITGQ